MTSPPFTEQHHPFPAETLPHFGNKWSFVGIDLAPNDTLETGVVMIDRQRQLMRMDKLCTDQDIFLFLKSLGPASNLIVALDVPKSLSIGGKWRQEEIKMHPLRLTRQNGEVIDRFAQRAKNLYALMEAEGIWSVLYFNYEAKMRYDLFIPFRTRTPQGCRTLQAAIKSNLQIPNVPSNLAPSSVLDAMIGAYVAWSLYQGEFGNDYTLCLDSEQRRYCNPLKRVITKRRSRSRSRYSNSKGDSV